MTILLDQDDTAPDSMIDFKYKFEIETGLSVSEFKRAAFNVTLQSGFIWKYKNHTLKWCCDNPFYQLIDNRV